MLWLHWGPQLLALAERHEKLAGWAQFIGAMFGIFAAIWAGGTQGRHERSIARRKRNDFLSTVEEATGFVTAAYDVVAKSADVGDWTHALADLGAIREISGIAVLEKAMEGHLSDWPSPLLFVHVQQFMFVTRLLAGMANSPIETSADGWNASLRLLQHRLNALSACKKEINAEIAKLRTLR